MDLMLAELLGKATGYCKGKGGSMHIADLDLGHLGANGIVGGGKPIATGAALGFRQLGLPHVVVARRRPPTCLQCCIAWTTPLSQASAEPKLVKRAVAYGVPGVEADGMDARVVRQVTAEAVERARCGEGPTLVVLETYRFEGHYVGDPVVYRTKEETESWKSRDPISLHRGRLLKEGLATEAEMDRIDADIACELEDADIFAQNSPNPDPSDLFTDVYSG